MRGARRAQAFGAESRFLQVVAAFRKNLGAEPCPGSAPLRALPVRVV